MKLLRRKPAPMPCRDVVELVTAYLEEALEPGDRERLEAHLARCEHCTAYVAQIRTTIQLTGRVELDDLSPPAREALGEVFRAWAAGGA